MGRTIRIGSVAGAPVLVSTWWFLVAAILTVVIAPSYSSWAVDLGQGGEYVLGAVFVALLYLSAFLHETGHAFTARAFGLRVHKVELTAFGGLTTMDPPQTPAKSAATSAAGPAVNAVLVVVALIGIDLTTPNTLPHLFAQQLAWTNGILAAFNLIPGLPLDGGAILRAGAWKVSGSFSKATVVAAWASRGVAIGFVLWFLRSVVSGTNGGAVSAYNGIFVLFIAGWMWTASTAALANERVRAVVPLLSARSLARPFVLVGPDDPVAVVMQRIADERARGALVTDPVGHVTGIVSEAAVAAAPRERWPSMAASSVARRFDSRLELPASLTGDDLMRALADKPATEYLVRDDAGSVVGVLAFADVEAALTRR